MSLDWDTCVAIAMTAVELREMWKERNEKIEDDSRTIRRHVWMKVIGFILITTCVLIYYYFRPEESRLSDPGEWYWTAYVLAAFAHIFLKFRRQHLTYKEAIVREVMET